MMEEAPEHGLDVDWLETVDKPKRSHSVGKRSARRACYPSRQGEIVLPTNDI